MSQLFFKQKSVGEFSPTPKVVEPLNTIIDGGLPFVVVFFCPKIEFFLQGSIYT
jgi:hypothetical protein